MIKESGIVERLKYGPSASHDYGSHLRKYQALCDEAATLIAELQAERDRIKAFLSEGSWATIESEQAWKRRALAAESSLHRVRGEAIEECAVQVECTDWIMPLQGKKEVDEFGKHVAVLTLKQAARGVRQILTPCMDEEEA